MSRDWQRQLESTTAHAQHRHALVRGAFVRDVGRRALQDLLCDVSWQQRVRTSKRIG